MEIPKCKRYQTYPAVFWGNVYLKVCKTCIVFPCDVMGKLQKHSFEFACFTHCTLILRQTEFCVETGSLAFAYLTLLSSKNLSQSSKFLSVFSGMPCSQSLSKHLSNLETTQNNHSVYWPLSRWSYQEVMCYTQEHE